MTLQPPEPARPEDELDQPELDPSPLEDDTALDDRAADLPDFDDPAFDDQVDISSLLDDQVDISSLLDESLLDPAPAYDAVEDQSLLKNPYMLAGLSVAAAIVLAVIVVVVFGSSGSSGSGGNNNNGGNDNGGVAIDPLTPLPGRGIAAPSIATATVREGPSSEYLEIGTLRAGQTTEVVGRNQDASWFQIYYPFQSQLKGWVPASALRVPADSIQTIPVVAATPIPRPTVVQPTATPEPPETPTTTPTVTATPGGGIDLKADVLNGNCQDGQQMVVQVSNVGSAPTGNRTVQISVSDSTGVVATNQFAINLEPNGPPVILPTGVLIRAPRITAQITLLNSPQDVNPGNNTASCVVAGTPQPTPTLPGGTATPTRTPTVRPTP